MQLSTEWEYRFAKVGGDAPISFATWKSTTGQDAHSLNVNPLFVAVGTDFHLQPMTYYLDPHATGTANGLTPRDAFLAMPLTRVVGAVYVRCEQVP